MIILLVLTFLLQADKVQVVEKAKSEVVSLGFSLNTTCGVFEITKRVVFALKDEGYGLISKRSEQNGCLIEGIGKFSHDAIMLRNGTVIDIIRNSETENIPQWLIQPFPTNPSLWHEPIQPTITQPTPVEEATPGQEDIRLALVRIEDKLGKLQEQMQELKEQEKQDTEKVQQQIDQVVKNAEKSAPKIIDWIIKSLTLGLVAAK